MEPYICSNLVAVFSCKVSISDYKPHIIQSTFDLSVVDRESHKAVSVETSIHRNLCKMVNFTAQHKDITTPLANLETEMSI